MTTALLGGSMGFATALTIFATYTYQTLLGRPADEL